MMQATPPPKVIHIKVGNMKLGAFNEFVNNNWPMIRELSQICKLVNVYRTRIMSVS